MEKILGTLTPGCRLSQLLCGPFICWGCCNRGMYDPPSFEPHDNKDMPRSKQPVIDYGKVASPDVADMILHESRPGLAGRRCFSNFWHVFLDGSFAYFDPQLE